MGASNYSVSGLNQPHWIQMLAANSQALASTPSSSGNSPSRSLEQLKANFMEKYPDYIFESSSIFGSRNSTYKVVEFPKKPAVAGETPHCTQRNAGRGAHLVGVQWQCGCALWTDFLHTSIKEITSEAGLPGAFSYYDCNTCPCFPQLAGIIKGYDKLLEEFPEAFTLSTRVERERQRKLVRQEEEARKQDVERQRLAAAEKAQQDVKKREEISAQYALEMAQAKEWASQKIKEEKAAAERLAAQAELAELFAPQSSQQHKHTPLMPSDTFRVPASPAATTVEYRAQDWMTKAQFRAMRQRAGFPLNADQHVCHIIADSNGGANHIDNYYVAAGSLNQSLGNRNDSYLAEAAGLEQTKKAVAVSRSNGYTGPGAEELIAMAKAARTGMAEGVAAKPMPSGGALYYDQVTPQQMATLPLYQREALESQRRAVQEQYESSNFTRKQRIQRGTW
uniref:Uncharacterized protein n=1 Tax=viral metagenome TaxID=1070528 RepID=A0A6C0AMB8_9ZZZZ